MANTRMRLHRSVGPPDAYKNLRAHRRLGVADVIARAKRRFGVVDVIACARDVGGKRGKIRNKGVGTKGVGKYLRNTS